MRWRKPGRVNRSNEEVLRFIAASFPSVWALELLIALRRERRLWKRQELVEVLRASELVVSRALEALVVAGLASIEDEGAVYLPVNSDVESCVEQVEQLYRSRPNSATAFADAFRLRKGKDD